MRLIDVDALCDEIESVDYFGKDPEVERICGLIQKAKWIDAVPAIRCNDCRFFLENWRCVTWHMFVRPDGYCFRAIERLEHKTESKIKASSNMVN